MHSYDILFTKDISNFIEIARTARPSLYPIMKLIFLLNSKLTCVVSTWISTTDHSILNWTPQITSHLRFQINCNPWNEFQKRNRVKYDWKIGQLVAKSHALLYFKNSVNFVYTRRLETRFHGLEAWKNSRKDFVATCSGKVCVWTSACVCVCCNIKYRRG